MENGGREIHGILCAGDLGHSKDAKAADLAVLWPNGASLVASEIRRLPGKIGLEREQPRLVPRGRDHGRPAGRRLSDEIHRVTRAGPHCARVMADLTSRREAAVAVVLGPVRATKVVPNTRNREVSRRQVVLLLGRVMDGPVAGGGVLLGPAPLVLVGHVVVDLVPEAQRYA